MSRCCILFDLPFCLTREICSVWLGGNGDTGQCLGLKTLLKLDTSVCNKQLRQSLLDVLSYQDWEPILTIYGSNCTGMRVRWVVARQIALPKLVLSNFPNDQETIKSFFKNNGMVLKVLKLSDYKGAMTLLTKAIASYCKVLETLSLERCNLTMPIADILNRTSTIKEVRFQNPLSYRSKVGRQEGICSVKTVLFDKVSCLSVTKLALLDPVLLEDADVIARAFPNVKDFEMHNSNGDVLVRLLDSWKDMETLRLMSMKDMGGSVILDIIAKVRQSVKTVVVENAIKWLANLPFLLMNLDSLSSVTIVGFCQSELLIARLAKRCGERLEVLNVSDMQVTQEDVGAIVEHCPNLRVLNMHNLGYCSNYDILLSKCTRLEKLRVSPGYRYIEHIIHTCNSEELLTSIATHCSNLHFLSLMADECYATPIPCDLLSNCPKLRVFETERDHWRNLVDKIKGVEVRPYPACSGCDRLKPEREF